MTRAATTRMLRAVCNGNWRAADELFPLVYTHLRERARRLRGRQGRADGPLQTTAVVHEAYLKMINQRQVRWNDRFHFCEIAAMAMRRVLADQAKAQKARKRGGGWGRIPLDVVEIELPALEGVDFSAVHLALARLEEIDPKRGRVVLLRFFGGLTMEEIALHLGVATRTVERHWRSARAWLKCELLKKGQQEISP